MENNKKYTELLWNGKYSESWLKEFFELRKKATINIEKPALAFQTVETINQPRVKGGAQSSLFPEKDWHDLKLKVLEILKKYDNTKEN